MITEAALLAAVAAAPLVFWTGSGDIFGLPKLAIISVLVAVAAVSAATSSKGAARRAPQSVVVPALLYVVVLAAATIASIAPTTSFFGTYERYGGLLSTLVWLAGAWLAVLVSAKRPAFLDRLRIAIVASSAVLALYVLAQWLGFDAIEWTDEIGNVVRYHAGSMGNSNFAGGQLGIALPLALSLVFAERRRPRRVAAALAVAGLCAASLWVTSSRGGLVAAIAGCATLGLFHHRTLLPSRRARVFGAVALTVVVILGIGVATRLTAVSTVGRDPLLRTESAGARLRTWTAATEMTLDRPAIGHGPDTFGLLYPSYRTAADARQHGLRITDKPHNIVLEHLAAGGPLLAGAYLLLLWRVGRRLVEGWRRSDDAGRAAAFGGATAAYLAQGMVSIDVPPLAFLGGILLAACVAAVPASEASERRPGSSTWVARSMAGLAVVAAATTMLMLTADLEVGAARRATGDRAARAYDRAIARTPWQLAYRVEAAFLSESEGARAEERGARARHLGDALGRYGEVERREPRSLPAVVGRARTLTLLARGVDADRFQDANDAWNDALELDPVDWEVLSAHALMLNSWANASGGDPAFRREAAAELERALAINPSAFHAWTNLTRVRLALGDRAGAGAALARAEALEPAHSDLPPLRAALEAGPTRAAASPSGG